MNTFKSLPEQKRDKLLRLMFNPREFKKATEKKKLNSDPSEVKNGVYQCPNCGHEDHSLAEWRRLQSGQEKWDEGLMRWYQKKKCERKCVAEATKESTVTRTPRAELFFRLNKMASYSNEVQKTLDKIQGNEETDLPITCDIEKTPQSRSSLQSPGTGLISPVMQKSLSKLDSLELYSQKVQEKIDAATSGKDGDESIRSPILESTLDSSRNSNNEDQDGNQSELREACNRNDSLLEDLGETPTNFSFSKETIPTSGISLREVNEAIHTSPRFETSTAEKTFTTISYQRREGAEPDMTPIIAVPEMTLNDSLPPPNPIQFSRTYYLSTIDEASRESGDSSREILREACLPEQEMNLISDQSQESLPVFSPKKMARCSTMFCLPPKSPSTDEPAEETRTAPLEASEIEVEDPSLDQTAQDSNSEPHMIIPIASGSRQGPFSRENTGGGAVGNGSIQVCQLVDDVKQYMSRLSGMFLINGKCSHY